MNIFVLVIEGVVCSRYQGTLDFALMHFDLGDVLSLPTNPDDPDQVFRAEIEGLDYQVFIEPEAWKLSMNQERCQA